MPAFKTGNPGCCCASHSIRVHVRGCGGLALAGASVELRLDGDLVGTATTDSLGLAVFTDLVDGTYSITASKSRFNAAVTPATPLIAVLDVYLTLTPATGFVCCGACADPMPEVLYFRSDGAGVVSLSWDTESGVARWIGSKTFSRPGLLMTYTGYGSCDFDERTCDVTVGFEVGCPVAGPLGNSWPVHAYADTRSLPVGYPYERLTPHFICDDSDLGPRCYVACLSGQAGGSAIDRIEADCVVPVSFAGTLPSTAGGGTYDGYLPGACPEYDGLPVDTLDVWFGGDFTVGET